MQIFLVLEYLHNGDLSQYLQQMRKRWVGVVQYVCVVCACVVYLHAVGCNVHIFGQPLWVTLCVWAKNKAGSPNNRWSI